MNIKGGPFMKQFHKILMILLLCFISIPTYAENIEATGGDQLLKYGFITGDNGDIMPDKALTRAEVAVIMTELGGVKEKASKYSGPTGFSDVEPNLWYSPYIAYAKANNLLSGYPDGTFKPNSEVTSKEFAAFLMNAMGYKNAYAFNDVLSFATDHNVRVEVNGITFVRGDAFEALWDAVNEPYNGSTVPIGVSLGKLQPSEIEQPKDAVTSVSANTANSIQVHFESAVSNPSKMKFTVKRNLNPVYLMTSWNSTYTVATLSSSNTLGLGSYMISIQDANLRNYGPYFTSVEDQKIARIELDSDTIERYNEYSGTIGYTLYDQYDIDITNSNLSRNLTVVSTTDHPQPLNDVSNGTLFIQHGTYPQSTNTLRSLDTVKLILSDKTTGFSVNKDLKISLATTAINDVRINGIVDQYNNSVDFIYSPNKTYYLDLTILNSAGRIVEAKEVFAEKGPTGEELLLIQCMNPAFCNIVRTVNPVFPNKVAYKITFVNAPPASIPVTFYVNSLNSITSTSKATYTANLIVQ